MTNQEKDFGNTGPENTAYDKQRWEGMRMRSMKYGSFRVATEPVKAPRCAKCHEEINGQRVLVNRRVFHYGCFGSK